MLCAQHVSAMERWLRAPLGAVQREAAQQEPYWVPLTISNPKGVAQPLETGETLLVRGLTLERETHIWSMATSLQMSHFTIYLDNHGTLEPLLSPAFCQAQPTHDSRRSARWLTPFVIPAWCDWYVEITFSATDANTQPGAVDTSHQLVLQGYQLK